MVRRTELYIPVGQLTRLSFSCESCGAIIVIDIADAKQRKKLQEDITDKWCAACGERIERTIYEALIDLIRWYEIAKSLKGDVHFVLSDEAALE